MRQVVYGAILCILIAACESHDELAFSNPIEFLIAREIAFCNWKVRCGWISGSENDECKGTAKTRPQVYPFTFNRFRESIEKKYSVFDENLAHACLDAWNKAGCTDNQREQAEDACASSVVLRGMRPAGAPCTASTDCANGLCFVSGRRIPNVGCMGVCTDLLSSGSTCDPENSLCRREADFCHPTAKLCMPRRAAGGLCASHGACIDGLRCMSPSSKGTLDEPGECQPRGVVGMPCGVDSTASKEFRFFDALLATSCELGLYCNLDNFICAARLNVGVSCIQSSACSDGFTCNGLAVNKRDPTIRARDGRCAHIADFLQTCDERQGPGCADTMGCEPGKQQCLRTRTPIGDTCGSLEDWPCQSLSYCDAVTLRCTPLRPLGADCLPPGTQGPNPCYDGDCNPNTNHCELTCI